MPGSSGRGKEFKYLSLWRLIFGVMALGHQKEVKLRSGNFDKTENGQGTQGAQHLCIRFWPHWNVSSLKAVTVSHSYLYPQNLSQSSG